MSARGLWTSLIALLFVGGVCAADVESNSKKKQPAEAPKLKLVTYPVADLVVPVDMDLTDNGCALEGGPRRCGSQALNDRLMQTIMNTIARDTWKDVGGQATMQYFPLGMALVVHQSVAVHKEILALLQALRRLQDQE